MGYPTSTIELPCRDSALAVELAAVELDPDHRLDELIALVTGEVFDPPGSHGHLCSTAWVIDEAVTHALLVRHRRLGWVVPGGHSEMGESLRAGAVRELCEETGLELSPLVSHPVLLQAARFPAGEHRAHTHWNLGFVFIADRRAPLVEENGAPVQWWPIDALPEPRVSDLTPNLARIVAWYSQKA
ncbi:MAG: NUDIX hydrolase [Acidimicrobiia bacterium]